MKGVTLSSFRKYVKPGATKDDLRKITDEQLATVYRRHYWDAVAGAELPDGVDYAVFDFAVNSGPDRAVKYLQAIVGVAQDGKIGPETVKATRARMHAGIINAYCDNRLAFLKGLKTWPTFGNGWKNRVKGVRSEALDMAARPTPENPTVIEKTVIEEKPVPVPVPVTPPSLDAPWWKSKEVLVPAVSGGGASILTALAGIPWQNLLILLVALGGIAGFLYWRKSADRKAVAKQVERMA